VPSKAGLTVFHCDGIYMYQHISLCCTFIQFANLFVFGLCYYNRSSISMEMKIDFIQIPDYDQILSDPSALRIFHISVTLLFQW